jgi:hypothetical protein
MTCITYAFELRIGAPTKRGLSCIEKYSEGALELASRFWAKNFLQSTALQGLGGSGA